MDMVIVSMKIRPRRLDGRRWREHMKPSRLHVFSYGETIFENLVNRHNRPHGDFRRAAMAWAVRNGDNEFEGMRWSRTAGCSCGCSPGFILRDTVRQDGEPVDYFADITDLATARQLFTAIADLAMEARALCDAPVDESWLRLVA